MNSAQEVVKTAVVNLVGGFAGLFVEVQVVVTLLVVLEQRKEVHLKVLVLGHPWKELVVQEL
jgi:hypothetical protein